MREAVLCEFFRGSASVAELRADLAGTVFQCGKVREYVIADMAADFEVTPAHLVRACDAVLAGELAPAALQVIGFCLVASDRFLWDGDTPQGALVAETAAD